MNAAEQATHDMPYPHSHDALEGWVTGAWYRASVCGVPMDFWVHRTLSRSELRPVALAYANGDYDPPPYNASDIESVRRLAILKASDASG